MTMCNVVLGAGVSVTANYTISSRTGSTIAAAPPSSTHYTQSEVCGRGDHSTLDTAILLLLVTCSCPHSATMSSNLKLGSNWKSCGIGIDMRRWAHGNARVSRYRYRYRTHGNARVSRYAFHSPFIIQSILSVKCFDKMHQPT